MTDLHETYMQRCLQLAGLGAGFVAPNPMVGAVLVHEGRIIGEGYHQQYGGPHAEVQCIDHVSAEDRPLIAQAALYVSLEPCAHHGKTPPCADRIIAEKIPEVIIGCVDSFSKVAGKGIEKLQAAGVKVTLGVLEKECRNRNIAFFTFHEQKRPYIILKWAQTQDGWIADSNRQPVKISQPLTDRLVHRWRSEVMGILVGKYTALYDNPRLTNRWWTGGSPVRMVLDPQLLLPLHLHLFDGATTTFVFNSVKDATEGDLHLIRVNFAQALLPQLLQVLYERQIQSLMVEGGAHLLQQFINARCWDEARIITGRQWLGQGLAAPVLKDHDFFAEEWLSGDRIQYFTRRIH